MFLASLPQRINTLGLPLKPQEVRNAIYRGIPSTFTKVLANEESFKRATNEKVPIRRMDDREYVTRFVAFQWFKSYYGGDMNDFLRRAMEEMAMVSNDERKSIHNLFIKTMDRAYELLGNHSFYRIEKTFKPRTLNRKKKENEKKKKKKKKKTHIEGNL